MIKTKYLTPLLAIPLMVSCSNENKGGDEPQTPFKPVLARLSAVDYRPAPGQFVNDMPEYEPGDTRETMDRKALEALNDGDLVSLGAFGGEVVMYLSSPITHNPDATGDFRVLGNAYLTGSTDNRITSSAEPGIVYVMEDTNANGRPDDTWYELRGEKYGKTTPVKVTYTAVENPTAERWVEWNINDGFGIGYLTCQLSHHDHSYFPQWLPRESVTVTGNMLPVNSFYDEATGQYKQYAYSGYADSYPNNSDESALSLRDAIDPNGNPVKINRIHFVKVVTGILDSLGPLGETSTEVGGIQLLHE